MAVTANKNNKLIYMSDLTWEQILLIQYSHILTYAYNYMNTWMIPIQAAVPAAPAPGGGGGGP